MLICYLSSKEAEGEELDTNRLEIMWENPGRKLFLANVFETTSYRTRCSWLTWWTSIAICMDLGVCGSSLPDHNIDFVPHLVAQSLEEAAHGCLSAAVHLHCWHRHASEPTACDDHGWLRLSCKLLLEECLSQICRVYHINLRLNLNRLIRQQVEGTIQDHPSIQKHKTDVDLGKLFLNKIRIGLHRSEFTEVCYHLLYLHCGVLKPYLCQFRIHFGAVSSDHANIEALCCKLIAKFKADSIRAPRNHRISTVGMTILCK